MKNQFGKADGRELTVKIISIASNLVSAPDVTLSLNYIQTVLNNLISAKDILH